MSILSFCDHCQKLNRIPSDKLSTTTKPVCGSCKQSLPIDGALQEVSDQGLSKIISQSEGLVVVDFWAEWCGPCRAFAPTFKAVSKEFIGKVTFLKSDTEKNNKTSQQFGIRSIPTLIVFKNGKEVDRLSGALPLESFRQWIKGKIAN